MACPSHGTNFDNLSKFFDILSDVTGIDLFVSCSLNKEALVSVIIIIIITIIIQLFVIYVPSQQLQAVAQSV
jgi:hypothetical protein